MTEQFFNFFYLKIISVEFYKIDSKALLHFDVFDCCATSHRPHYNYLCLLCWEFYYIFLVEQVILYRSGLVTGAASFVVAASAAFLPADSLLSEMIKQNLDLFYMLGAGGLGLSLVLIHIYVTEIKRTLQALWALGVVGSLATYTALARPAGENLVQYVIDNPTAVWFVGPLFAALTGLVFKEGKRPFC